jgi:hypothetical protein
MKTADERLIHAAQREKCKQKSPAGERDWDILIIAVIPVVMTPIGGTVMIVMPMMNITPDAQSHRHLRVYASKRKHDYC